SSFYCILNVAFAWLGKLCSSPFLPKCRPYRALKIMFTFFSTKMSPLQGLKKCDRLFIAYLMLPLHGLENYASLLFYQYIALTGL
ncbi:MAG TPA: hypothetical protein PLC62_08370, partial [Chitinophagaceae bacterium]|nr:hypothetical protein [Chitinophagaceae bacterium]